jgi:RNA polymerase sigma-70 factor (ECF subfamily)
MSDPDHHHGAWIRRAVDQFEGPLVRYAARLLGDVDRARDVVQDTFLRLVREEPQSLDGHLRQWLFTVCRRRALDVRQKESRMNALTDALGRGISAAECPSHNGDGADRTDDPAAIAERSETAAAVLAEVAKLPERQQEIVRLKFQDNLSYREIAAVTGLTATNVGYLLHTAMTALRRRTDG